MLDFFVDMLDFFVIFCDSVQAMPLMRRRVERVCLGSLFAGVTAPFSTGILENINSASQSDQ